MDRLGRQGGQEKRRDGEKDMATVWWKMRHIHMCVCALVCCTVEMHMRFHAHAVVCTQTAGQL